MARPVAGGFPFMETRFLGLNSTVGEVTACAADLPRVLHITHVFTNCCSLMCISKCGATQTAFKSDFELFILYFSVSIYIFLITYFSMYFLIGQC